MLNQGNLFMKHKSLWRWWAKALGEKASKCDKESDSIALIRTLHLFNLFDHEWFYCCWCDSPLERFSSNSFVLIMKYQVTYLKPKKKTYSKQIVTFYTIEDATLWEKHILSQGCKDSEIIPIFS